jgi:hypothetical protein
MIPKQLPCNFFGLKRSSSENSFSKAQAFWQRRQNKAKGAKRFTRIIDNNYVSLVVLVSSSIIENKYKG